MPHLYRMRDNTDKHTIKKSGELFNLPMRLGLVGRTGAGKTSVIGNLLARKDYYLGDFNGDDIYIFSGSLDGDAKLKTIINQLDIPKSNLFDKYDGGVLHTIYDHICELHNEAIEDKRTPKHSLIILDDVSFTGAMARHNAKDDAINRVISNGRKFLVSIIQTAQKYTQLSTTSRENLSGVMIGPSTLKQLELITADWCYLKDKNNFKDMFRRQTQNSHDYFIANIESPAVYLAHDFSPLDELLIEKSD